MIWIWIFILLAVGVVAGPILSFVPKKHQRQLAQLRAKAAAAGLRVQIADLSNYKNKMNPNVVKDDGLFARYSLFLNSEDSRALKTEPAWQLLNTDMSHDIHVYQHWNWANDKAQGGEQWENALAKLLSQTKSNSLISRSVMVEFSPQCISLCWRENIDDMETVNEICSLLTQLKRFALKETNEILWPA